MTGPARVLPELTCKHCGKVQARSEALAIATSPKLGFDPVLGAGSGLRLRTSSFRWHRPTLVPLDPLGGECPVLACCNPKCLQPILALEVGRTPGGPVTLAELRTRPIPPDLARLRAAAIQVGIIDEPDEDRREKIRSYVAAMRPQIDLMTMLAEWSRIGLYSEVESVLEVSPEFMSQLAIGGVTGVDAERLQGQMDRLGMPEQCPVFLPEAAEAIERARQAWANYRGVRKISEDFRCAVLDRHIRQVAGARRTAAIGVLELSGAHWATNLAQTDAAMQEVLSKELAHPGNPEDARERYAHELLRTDWLAPLPDHLRQTAETVIWSRRVERTSTARRSGTIDEFCESMRLWYLGVDESDGDFESFSVSAEQAMRPHIECASELEAMVQSEIERLLDLQSIAAAAESGDATRQIRREAARRAGLLGRQSSMGPNTATVTALVNRAQQPLKQQDDQIGRAVALSLSLIFLPIILVILAAFAKGCQP
jgi:hypothetical protein